MLKMVNNLLITLMLLSSWSAYSFPLYYKCEAGDQLSDSFAGPEILQQVQAMLDSSKSDVEFNQRALSLCQGAQQCLEEIGRIKSLLGDTTNALVSIYNVRSRLESQSLSYKIDPQQFAEIKTMVDDAYTIRACSEIKKTWNPDLWTSEDNDNFAVFYPKYSNYMYASGCYGRSSGANCPGNRISDYKEKIKSALLMGMDPYLAIALVWMEGGTKEGLNYLYLDPVGKFAALGCTGGATRQSQATEMSLESFGTFYDINPAIKKNPALTKKLDTFLKAKGKPTEKGHSYFCRRINDDLGLVYDTPDRDSCCLELPFKKESVDLEYVEEALVFEQARKNYQTRFHDHEDPAFRIQRFNGYSRLMGATEEVESFRAGVDHYQDPAYGYQAMDFIISSIMPNPVFKKMVDDAENEVKATTGNYAPWRSIMCVEHPGGGTFSIDSEYYFNLHRNTGRLEAAAEKWKNGLDLSGAEKSLMNLEINTLLKRGIMSEEELNVDQKTLYTNYFENYYPQRSTVGAASANQSAYTWENLTKADLRRIGKNTIGR